MRGGELLGLSRVTVVKNTMHGSRKTHRTLMIGGSRSYQIGGRQTKDSVFDFMADYWMSFL